jgi:phosphate-induced protein 1
MKTTCSPFVIGMLVLGAFLPAVNLRAQGNSGRPTRPSYEHGDVHRGAPHNGAPTGGAVVTGNGINYNGGPVMHNSPVNLYYILYGSTWPTNAPTILDNWAAQIGGTPYFNINTTYGDTVGNVPNAVTFVGTYTDSGTLGNSLSDASIGTLTSNAINHGFPGAPVPAGTADPNGLYMVLTAPGVAETSGFLSSYCGWHWSGSFVSGAVQEGTIYPGYPVVKFAFIGDAAGPSFGACAVQSTSPNGDAGADAMISVMAHELAETVSDPEGNAWYASNGEENGDLCAWNFGSTYAAPNGSSANVNINGTNYLMQQIWVNALGGKCVLSYAAAPDFSISATPSSRSVTQGTGTTYTATVTPSGGFSGSVSLSVSGLPSGASGSFSPASIASGNSTLTVTTTASAPAGTYALTITGTSGALTHNAPVSLTVTVPPTPDFSISATPSSRSVAQGAGTTYTATVTPSGGFSSTVGLSVSGLPSGATGSFSPASIASGNSTLTVTTSASTPAGTYSLTITGSGGGLTHSAALVALTVTVPADFTISAPASISVSRKSSGKAAVTVTAVGASSSVTLSVSGAPSKVTTSFAANPVTASGSSMLTISVNPTATKGTYTFMINGNNGTNLHGTPLKLTIN